MQIKAKKIKEITLTDPDTHLRVDVTIYKEEGGGMFGVDSSFLSNTDLPVYSPFIRGRVVKLEEQNTLPVSYEVKVYLTKDSFQSHKADDTYEDFPTKAIAMKFVEEKKKGSYYAIKVQSEDREDIEIFLK